MEEIFHTSPTILPASQMELVIRALCHLLCCWTSKKPPKSRLLLGHGEECFPWFCSPDVIYQHLTSTSLSPPDADAVCFGGDAAGLKKKKQPQSKQICLNTRAHCTTRREELIGGSPRLGSPDTSSLEATVGVTPWTCRQFNTTPRRKQTSLTPTGNLKLPINVYEAAFGLQEFHEGTETDAGCRSHRPYWRGLFSSSDEGKNSSVHRRISAGFSLVTQRIQRQPSKN